MLNSRIIDLREDGSAYMTTYIQEHSSEMMNSDYKPCVVICPGGGYEWCSFREGEPVALEYLAKGFNCFVVNYSVARQSGYPNPIVDLSKAIRLIRQNADEWHIIKDQIAVLGFSAGGHLVSTLAVHWNDKEIQKLSECYNDENKPNACLLIYPVITMKGFTHEGTKLNVLGTTEGEQREELIRKLSNEDHIGEQTPPCFIASTFDDSAVPIENSLAFADGMAKADRPFELHIFRSGVHGLSTATPNAASCVIQVNPDFGKWLDLSILWLTREFGFNNIPGFEKKPEYGGNRARER